MFDNFIHTTNAGELAIKIDEKIKYGLKFSGSNIVNNVSSALE